MSTDRKDAIQKHVSDIVALERHIHKAVQRQRDGVIWIDEMLDKPSVIELYSHAAVFCCPSIYEPFGIINLEAMACETAVVASAVGGIPEIVVPGETGLLVGYIPGWPGAHSQGETLDELQRNMAEVVAMLLEEGEPELEGEFMGTQTVTVGT